MLRQLFRNLNFELWIILKNEFCLENATMFQIQDMFENWKPNIVEIPKTQCFNLFPFLTLSIRNGPSVSFGIFELSSCRNFKFNRFYYKAGLFTSTLSIHRNRKAFKLIRFYSCFQSEPSLFKDVQWEWWTTCKDWRHVLALRYFLSDKSAKFIFGSHQSFILQIPQNFIANPTIRI